MIIAIIVLLILNEMGIIYDIKESFKKILKKFKKYPLQMGLRLLLILMLSAVFYAIVVLLLIIIPGR